MYFGFAKQMCHKKLLQKAIFATLKNLNSARLVDQALVKKNIKRLIHSDDVHFNIIKIQNEIFTDILIT